MYEFLKKLFGEGETLTWEQLEAKIKADTDLKLVNLADGGYVAKDKHDAKVTELAGVKSQLEDANTEIKSYKDMDIEGIQKKAAEWEQKYEADTTALKKQLDDQQYSFAAQDFLGTYKFRDDMAKEAVLAKFMAKQFKLVDGKFEGADSFMAELQKAYPTSFVTEEPAKGDGGKGGDGGKKQQPANGGYGHNYGGQTKPGQQPRPWFAPPQQPQGGKKKRSLSEIMKFANEHPDAEIDFDE